MQPLGDTALPTRNTTRLSPTVCFVIPMWFLHTHDVDPVHPSPSVLPQFTQRRHKLTHCSLSPSPSSTVVSFLVFFTLKTPTSLCPPRPLAFPANIMNVPANADALSLFSTPLRTSPLPQLTTTTDHVSGLSQKGAAEAHHRRRVRVARGVPRWQDHQAANLGHGGAGAVPVCDAELLPRGGRGFDLLRHHEPRHL